MKLDIATTALLAQFASADGPPMHEMSPDEARLVGEAMAGAYPDGPEMAETRDIEIPASDGGKIPARIHRPVDAPKGVLIYYHGGGWVLSNIDQYDCVGRQLAERTACTVLLVDYRKAPEFEYPTAPNDAWDALNWAATHGAELGGKDLPLMVGGDSAGGNLAAIVCQKAKAAGGPEIAMQLLIYPVTDCDMTRPTYADMDNQLLLNTPMMKWFWDYYAPNEDDRKNVDASPLRADDLSGLPPAVVITAEYDILREESEAYAAALRKAGVPVTHKQFDRQMHNFFAMPGLLPAQAKAIEYVGDQISQHIARFSEADAVIVGAGFAGMYQLKRLREMGLKVRVLEAGDGVGGTWYWNRYPGARCDIESLGYSFGFDPELEQEWGWTERYATQPEILTYAQHVADRYDLKKDITFETRVTRAIYDEDTERWTIYTDTGEAISTQFYIMATGCLSVPKEPDIEGSDSFEGPTYITGRWPHEGVDFTGKKVAVIGTGSSAIQSIPHIAEQASHLTVYQRTPAYSLPAGNRPLSNSEVSEMKERYRDFREEQKYNFAGIPHPKRELEPAAMVPPEERQRRLEEGWTQGLTGLTTKFADTLVDEEANEVVANYIREQIKARVDDPELAETLTPYSYPFGTKRPCLDTNYYETFNRDNVSLVDLRKTPMERITPKGIKTSEGEEAFDVIVFATGFDAMTGAILNVDIRGKGGLALADKWANGPHTYLGLAIEGFPNLFTITGPSSPSVLSNMMVSIEQHVDWVSDCIGWMRGKDLATIEPTEAAEDEWAEHNEAVAEQTLFPQANSWYIGANVPGKPRTFMAYIAGVDVYRIICDQIAASGYHGFETSKAKQAAVAA
ncbi:alpha/beta hydrolase fold domain-containing protein [Henriciella litoralis]|uniref:alpha/beta hydrolase fold domain-containing protein n=1 Tax=Henriciella litoralis TaxID=568102 RepID=UPI000A070B88|nr:alpha/beta hydrolase fold domain-containing protein [Henriciella litoralis]